MKINFNQLLIAVFFLTTTVIITQAQTVTGTILDSDGFPVSEAEIAVQGSSETTYTDADGNFSFTVPAGEGVLEIFSLNGTQTLNYNVADGATQNLGDFNLSPTLEEIVAIGKGVIDIESDRQTPVAVNTILKDEIQEKSQGNTEFPEVLKNTPNVYVSNQSGGFGDSQMFTRGFDQSNTAFLLNGQPINGMEDGKMYWSNWSGMTDIANAVQIQRGLGSSKLAISSVGGTINIITKATDKKRGGNAFGVIGNDSYFKLGAGYDTGISDKGWAFSIAFSHWQAHRKYARGTKGQGQNYFLSVGKKINEKHNLNFLITGAPQWHDQNFSKQYDYGNGLGYDYFGEKWNSNAGFTNSGEYKTWRRNYYHKPIINLNWDWEINDKASLSYVAYASFGRGGGTGPFGNTRPFDVFRNQPTTLSYYNLDGSFNFGEVENQNALVAGGLGSFGDGVAIRASVNNHNWFGDVVNFNYKINDNLSFNIGADARFYKGDHFRQLVDLLGLNSYSDTFRRDPSLGTNVVSATFDANPWASLFSFADEGERVAYDYSEKINYIGGFGQIEYANDKFSIFTQGSFSNQNYEREGRWADLGSSDKIKKTGYNIKGGAAYNLNQENTIYVNAGIYSRQPFLDNIFENMRYSNSLVSPEVDNEDITGLEAGYKFSKTNMNLNINVYHTTWDNRTLLDFGSTTYTQRTGVKQEHKGFELDFFAKATSKLNVRTHFTYGDWNIVDGYREREFDDNTGALISDTNIVLTIDEKVSQAPQLSFGAGLVYKLMNNLTLDTDLNYYGKFYSRQGFNTQLDPFALMDAGVTYKFKLGSQKLKFRGNIKNLFNTPYVNQADQFGYFLGNGRTWNAGVSVDF